MFSSLSLFFFPPLLHLFLLSPGLTALYFQPPSIRPFVSFRFSDTFLLIFLNPKTVCRYTGRKFHQLPPSRPIAAASLIYLSSCPSIHLPFFSLIPFIILLFHPSINPSRRPSIHLSIFLFTGYKSAALFYHRRRPLHPRAGRAAAPRPRRALTRCRVRAYIVWRRSWSAVTSLQSPPRPPNSPTGAPDFLFWEYFYKSCCHLHLQRRSGHY